MSSKPWNEWEDYAAGLYRPVVIEEAVADSVRLLADAHGFYEVACEMLRAWPNAAHHNLRHMWSGRRAWIGQASCCYAHAATAAATREAWGLLTNQRQREANAAADAAHDKWSREVHDAQASLGL